MLPTRRFVLAATGALIVAPRLVRAADADPRMAPRALGSATAKVTVEEWFSFTCPHCARFEEDVFPEIKTKLIDTGKIRYVFREYIRDQTDLLAACAARSLPPERYIPFMDTLFATQAHWAFDRNVDPKDELQKMAALAGLPREAFEKAVNDETLKTEITTAQEEEAEKKYNIESTPSFIVNGQMHSGEVTYDIFAGWIGT